MIVAKNSAQAWAALERESQRSPHVCNGDNGRQTTPADKKRKANVAVTGLRRGFSRHERLHTPSYTELRQAIGFGFSVGHLWMVQMTYEQQRDEWKLLKDQFDALIRNEGARSDSIDKLFDDEVCHRVGEMISSSLLKPRACRRYS